MRRFRIVVQVLALLAFTGTPAFAQNAANASNARELLQAFMIRNPTLETVEKFNERRELLTAAITNSLAIGIATVPVGGSSAAFIWVTDPTTGARTSKSDTFGPLFLDRPLTAGRGVFRFGFNYNYVSFDRFQGVDLRNDGLLVFDNRVLYPNLNYTQYIEEYVALEPSASVFTGYVSFGVTDKIDVAAIVPFASVNLKGRRYWNYDVSKTYPVDANDRAFFTQGPIGTNFVQDSGEVSASGIGDITLRGTVELANKATHSAAVIGSLRLPTGDSEQLLGTGSASAGVKLVVARAVGERSSVYANGGFGFGGLSEEITYGAGIDAALLERKNLTVSFEVLGQNLRDSVNGTDRDGLGPLQTTDFRFTPPQPVTYSAFKLTLPPGSVNTMRGAAGAKYLLGGGALLSGGVLFPIGDQGLRAGLTAFVGLDVTVLKR